MGIKHILSDTDSQHGIDTRFKNAVTIGYVTKQECDDKHANVRVILPDKKDHNGTPLFTKPIPVLQVASEAKKSYSIPRIGTPVALIKLANGTSSYLVVGSFYTTNDPPPVSDPMLDFVIYDDGSTMQFNASTGELTWRIKGKMDMQSEKEIIIKSSGDKVTVEGSGDVLVKSDSGQVTVEGSGDVTVKSDSGQVTIQATAAITIQAATINLIGNIVHTGDITTSGHHTDAHGVHKP